MKSKSHKQKQKLGQHPWFYTFMWPNFQLQFELIISKMEICQLIGGTLKDLLYREMQGVNSWMNSFFQLKLSGGGKLIYLKLLIKSRIKKLPGKLVLEKSLESQKNSEIENLKEIGKKTREITQKIYLQLFTKFARKFCSKITKFSKKKR